MDNILVFFKNCAQYFMSMGDIGLFIMAFMESSFFPIPPDVVLIPMCLMKPENAFFFAFIATAGSALGGVLGYAIGKFGGRPVLHFFFKKQHDKIEQVEQLYNKYGVWAVGAAAFTPIPYKIFTIASGVFNMNLLGFTIISIVGRGLRFFIVATLLVLFGESIKSNIEIIIIALSILIIVFYVLISKLKIFHKKED